MSKSRSFKTWSRSKTPVGKRCPIGTRKNRKTGRCRGWKQLKRCKRGTRRGFDGRCNLPYA